MQKQRICFNDDRLSEPEDLSLLHEHRSAGTARQPAAGRLIAPLDTELTISLPEDRRSGPPSPAIDIDSGLTALDEELLCACKAGDKEVIRILLLQGADPNAASLLGDTALILAAIKGKAGSVALLLDAGAMADAANQFGRTALIEHVSSLASRVEVVSLLIAAGADVNARDNTGRTALMESCTFGCESGIASRLLEAGAAVDAQDELGRTALLETVSSVSRSLPKMTELATLLLDRGADPDLASLDGETPLMKAATFCSRQACVLPDDSCDPLELVKLLVKRGANVSTLDSRGRTVMAYASHKSVRRFLKSRGAKLKRWWLP